VGDRVGVYFSPCSGIHVSSESLEAVGVVEKILDRGIVVVRGFNYGEDNAGNYRHFTDDGYTHEIIRKLSDEGWTNAEAVIARKAKLCHMRYELSRLVAKFSDSDVESFLEYVKKFPGT
jgi:hypothetical protein